MCQLPSMIPVRNSLLFSKILVQKKQIYCHGFVIGNTGYYHTLMTQNGVLLRYAYCFFDEAIQQ